MKTKVKDYLRSLLGREEPLAVNNKPETPVTVPGSRVSKPVVDSTYSIIKNKTQFVNPDFIAQYIPVIRKLSWINPDMGQVVNDMVQLTNTGHNIKFDPSVTSEQQQAMRQHLEEKQLLWGDGVNGMNGLVNKFISQIWIGGALSNEAVVNRDKTGISNIALVNPETIIFSWNKRKGRFQPYQRQNQKIGDMRGGDYKKLNTNTYKYYGLIGDTEIPYGIPPFLTALNPLSIQAEMDKNTKFIIKQIGLLGFFELLMTKPAKAEGETDPQYKARLSLLLDEAKANMLNGIQDGVVVGFEDDHEFNFNSTTKDLNGVSDIYNLNEQQVANGLKSAGQFLGIGGSGAETGINIIFTKMLSQLTNVQEIIIANLKFIYSLELRLAGFNFSGLRVEFNPSTITDELKFQQGQEYKLRNVYGKYQFGIISMQQAADELGYDKPDATEPRGPIGDMGKDKEDREKDKDDSDRKTRDKKKPQPKRKDQKKNELDPKLINTVLDFLNDLKQ